jgi:hypothetical protein
METAQLVLKKNKDDEKLDALGRKLYHSNENMKNIANVMENPEFAKFFDTYFQDWNDVKSIVMLMKVYQKLHIHFGDLNGYQRLAMVYEAMGNSKTRQLICENTTKWSSENLIMSDADTAV